MFVSEYFGLDNELDKIEYEDGSEEITLIKAYLIAWNALVEN